MLIRLPDGSTATVRCVVKIPINGSVELVELGRLSITPWHPIRTAAGWTFPASIGEITKRTDVSMLYNLVLDRGHIVIAGGQQVCTLGHNIEGPVIGHPFFGTDRVINALKTDVSGWLSGIITIDGSYEVRKAADGTVADVVRSELVNV